MRSDKAFLPVGETTCIERVISTARRVADQVSVVANEPSRYEQLGVPILADVTPGFGPLSGIQTALTYCRSDWAIVLACDLPFVSAALLSLMLERREGVEAVVPMDKDGVVQPLCALYSPGCLPATVELINSGASAPRLLFDKVKTRVLPFTEIAPLDSADLFFLDIDDPTDYQRALTFVQSKSRIAS